MPAAALLIWLIAFLTLGVTSLTPGGRMAIASTVADVFGWVLWLTARVAPTIAVQFAKGLVTAFEKDRETWSKVVKVFADEITSIVGAGGAGAPVTTGIPGAARDIAAPLTSAVLNVIAPAGVELTPEQGATNLQGLLGLVFALGLQGWWVEAVGELVSLGKFRSAADLPAAVETSLGLTRLGRLAYRTPIKKAIAEPLEELYNRRYKRTRLTIGEALKAWHQGHLDDAGFIDVAESFGYTHDKAALLLSSARTPYTVAQIEELGRFESVGEDILLFLLRDHGYETERGRTILALARERETQKILDSLATTARRLFRQGKVTEQQLDAMMAEAHIPQRDRQIIMAEEQLLRAEGRSLTTGELLLAARHETLTAVEVRQRLRQLGYANDDIDVLLGNERRQLSTGQIVDALTRGRIPAGEAVRRLEAEGYTPEDAQLIVSLRGRRLTEGQIMDALNQRLINVQQARVELAALGFDPDQVDILLSFMRKQLSPADVQVALTRGLITEVEAQEKLQRLGFSPADALVIIELRRRILREGQILDAFGDGLLTRVETLSDLQVRGFSPEDALQLVRVFELHQEDLARKRRAGQAAPAVVPPHPQAPSARRLRTGAPPPPAPLP